MFKLRRLEITGFKSFADHTDLIFTGEGITSIVGPNGCGKSNVADAIAWVLGEQRVKHLRGGEMKDVIFQGSRNRPPGGMAEVVLHLVRDEIVESEPDIEDIDSTLARRGLAIPGGTCPTVAISGLTLGGGFGFSSRQLGLTADNLLELTLVTATGPDPLPS